MIEVALIELHTSIHQTYQIAELNILYEYITHTYVA